MTFTTVTVTVNADVRSTTGSIYAYICIAHESTSTAIRVCEEMYPYSESRAHGRCCADLALSTRVDYAGSINTDVIRTTRERAVDRRLLDHSHVEPWVHMASPILQIEAAST